LILAMCNSIFGKGQQVVGAGQDGVRRGLTFVCRKATLQTYRRVDQFIVTVCSLKALKHLAKPRLAWML